MSMSSSAITGSDGPLECAAMTRQEAATSHLPRLLRWSGSSEECAAIFKEYQKHLFFSWANTVTQSLQANPASGKSLVAKVRALPQDSLRRFLTAPAVVYRLQDGVSRENADEMSRFFSDALDAEYCLLAGKTESGRTLWTALGDWSASDLEGAVLFQAPLVANHIPLDCKSPFAKSDEMERFYGSYADFTSSETDTILKRFDEAAGGISQSSSEVMEFIKLFTRVIVARKNAGLPDQIGSRSFSRHIGATVIENPHNSHTDAATLADSLVHEAIHHLLYSLELQHPFISRHDVAKTFRVASPWTGRNLSLRQYLHACVVWFGLWGFWSLCVDSAVFPRDLVRSNVRRAALGYKQAPLLEALSPVRAYVSTRLQDSISDMQLIVSNAQ